jgi:hypothetical protein|tara:strand:- start:409 stop:666 length:258 start_codon:yes stop_codon:yes gene_type:complete
MTAYKQLFDFMEYVWSFYGEHDDTLYPIKGLTKGDIFLAIFTYRDRIIQAENDNNSYYTWGDGDSLDRERVRDIILENPQFTSGW